MNVIVLLVPTAIITWALTGWMHRYALSRQMLDLPNSRSSHVTATPRGGGAAFALVFLCAIALGVWLDQVAWQLGAALGGAGSCIALLGFWDDRGHVPVRWRLLGHTLSAVWLLSWIGGLPALPLGGQSLDLGWVGGMLAALYLVWMLNLYNFMDGINGIAAIEALLVCAGGALLAMGSDNTAGLYLTLILAAAISGFLPWNFPNARIFMGDVGSSFLGLTLGGLALQAAWSEPRLFWSWMILLSVFIVDASWTLLRRLTRGERVHLPHRNHAYQHAALRAGSHTPVTSCVALINGLWLLPIALWVGLYDGSEVLGLLLAWLPLLAVAIFFRAGEKR